MDCLECRHEYELYKSGYYDSGLWATTYHWVKKSTYEAFKQREAVHKELQQCITDQARQKYLGVWLKSFEVCKTKKSVWKRLTGGSGYPSLSTFYNSLRWVEREEYIDRWFDWSHLQSVMVALEVADSDIQVQLERERELAMDCERLAKAMW